jgi:hypothetical protein
MAIVVPNVGEVELLDKMIKDALSVDENYTLKLYTAVSPAIDESTTAAHFTEADFTGYSTKTLTRANWGAASTSSGTTSSVYAQQSWTNTGSTQVILGYWVVGATSGVLLWCEAFTAAETLNNGGVLNVTPRFELA